MTSLTALANLIFQNLLGDCLRKQTLFIQPPNDVTDDPAKFDIPEPIGGVPSEAKAFFLQPSNGVTDDHGKVEMPESVRGLPAETNVFYITTQ